MPRLFAFGLLLTCIGCSYRAHQTSWLTGDQRAAEALAGERAAAALERDYGGVHNAPQAEVRFEQVGMTVVICSARPSDECWHFTLLDSDKPNAFALPGNRIYMTRGLYERIGDDDSLLAAAVAHEMAHIEARDCFKPNCQSACEGLCREQAADLQATAYLEQAGYPAEGLARLLRLISDAQPAGWADARIRYITAAR